MPSASADVAAVATCHSYECTSFQLAYHHRLLAGLPQHCFHSVHSQHSVPSDGRSVCHQFKLYRITVLADLGSISDAVDHDHHSIVLCPLDL